MKLTRLIPDLPDDLASAPAAREPGERQTRVAPPPKRHLRIGVLSYRSDPHVGGQGIYLDYLTRALVDRGHSVDIISGPPYPTPDPRVGVIRLESLDLYAQPHNGHYALRPKHLVSATDTYEYFGHLSGKFVEPYTFGQRAKKWLKRHSGRYDVILDNQTLAEGPLLATAAGTPLVTVIHHPITRDRRLALAAEPRWKHRLLIRRWYAFHHMQKRVARKVAFIVTPSHATKADIIEDFGVKADRVTPILLGVDQETFRPRSQIERASNTLITTASADVPLKGLIQLVRAYASVLQKRPDVKLTVIGKLRDGPTRREIERLGLSSRIEFRSGLSRDELAQAFCAASIAVTPSLYEGFGLPCAEAMSCGTPVIVTNGGALPEVAGDTGCIVPAGDPSALAAAILHAFETPGYLKTMSAAVLEDARYRFNWAHIAPVYEDVFERALAD